MILPRRWALSCLAALLAIGPVAAQDRIADYEQARRLFWDELYGRGGHTLYCGVAFSTRYRRGLNIEHVFPMSWVARDLKCGKRKQCRLASRRFNLIEADLHNLYPARVDVNDARSSHRFGELAGERRLYRDCDFEIDDARRVVEPRPAARGEIARAMFYMKEEYGLTIFRRHGEMLKRWHRGDPPSNHERWRNDRIERIQGNRNRFVDDPSLVDLLTF